MMPPSIDLQDLVNNASESMWCELKDWQDVSDKVVLAKLARHLAALANYGGGYVLIGYSDAEEEVPIGVIDPASYTRDAITQLSGTMTTVVARAHDCRADFRL